jgi:RNA polymerase sigma-70 factor (ECF subfamily)
MTSDEALIVGFQRGSREAFEELFARYREPMYGFFRRRIEDASRAEELTQDVFLAVIRNIVRYEPRALVKTYLYGIAMRLLQAERRRWRPSNPPGEPEPEAPAVLVDEVLWLRGALASLEARDREILMLREYEQLSYAEIAELLRLPLNTVRSRLFRAREELKRMLDGGKADQSPNAAAREELR